MRQGRAATQTGTSAPSDRPWSAGRGCPVRSDSARSVAAASDDPPPMPAAAGRCFSRVIAAPVTPIARAARRTRLESSVGTPAAIGPVTVSDRSCAGATRTVSPTSAKTTSESRR